MSIIVGFVPTPAGEAALVAGIAEARLRNEDLLIVNSAREGALVDKSVAPEDLLEQAARRAADAGVKATVIQPPYQHDLADEFLDVAREANASLIVIGLRRGKRDAAKQQRARVGARNRDVFAELRQGG